MSTGDTRSSASYECVVVDTVRCDGSTGNEPAVASRGPRETTNLQPPWQLEH